MSKYITGIPCVIEGVSYPSMAAAARSLNVGTSTVRQHLIHGHRITRKKKVDNSERNAEIVRRVNYGQKHQAVADDMGITRNAVSCVMTRYKRAEGIIGKNTPTPCNVNGKDYPSIRAASRDLGVSAAGVWGCLKYGHRVRGEVLKIRA